MDKVLANIVSRAIGQMLAHEIINGPPPPTPPIVQTFFITLRYDTSQQIEHVWMLPGKHDPMRLWRSDHRHLIDGSNYVIEMLNPTMFMFYKNFRKLPYGSHLPPHHLLSGSDHHGFNQRESIFEFEDVDNFRELIMMKLMAELI